MLSHVAISKKMVNYNQIVLAHYWACKINIELLPRVKFHRKCSCCHRTISPCFYIFFYIFFHIQPKKQILIKFFNLDVPRCPLWKAISNFFFVLPVLPHARHNLIFHHRQKEKKNHQWFFLQCWQLICFFFNVIYLSIFFFLSWLLRAAKVIHLWCCIERILFLFVKML